jgi:hypothetical protein
MSEEAITAINELIVEGHIVMQSYGSGWTGLMTYGFDRGASCRSRLLDGFNRTNAPAGYPSTLLMRNGCRKWTSASEVAQQDADAHRKSGF